MFMQLFWVCFVCEWGGPLCRHARSRKLLAPWKLSGFLGKQHAQVQTHRNGSRVPHPSPKIRLRQDLASYCSGVLRSRIMLSNDVFMFPSTFRKVRDHGPVACEGPRRGNTLLEYQYQSSHSNVWYYSKNLLPITNCKNCADLVMDLNFDSERWPMAVFYRKRW